jgi:hypothetical protein
VRSVAASGHEMAMPAVLFFFLFVAERERERASEEFAFFLDFAQRWFDTWPLRIEEFVGGRHIERVNVLHNFKID